MSTRIIQRIFLIIGIFIIISLIVWLVLASRLDINKESFYHISLSEGIPIILIAVATMFLSFWFSNKISDEKKQKETIYEYLKKIITMFEKIDSIVEAYDLTSAAKIRNFTCCMQVVSAFRKLSNTVDTLKKMDAERFCKDDLCALESHIKEFNDYITGFKFENDVSAKSRNALIIKVGKFTSDAGNIIFIFGVNLFR